MKIKLLGPVYSKAFIKVGLSASQGKGAVLDVPELIGADLVKERLAQKVVVGRPAQPKAQKSRVNKDEK